MTALTNYFSGVAAESAVAKTYLEAGYVFEEARWRGRSGEIDLILRQGDTFIFVEVKKSANHEQAAARITPRQTRRIMQAALEFVADHPKGQDTSMRFDAALVDQFGQVSILESALCGLV
ncbi:YraN family protein [Nereida sp. MMG025]|uniref:YraN family protein n=1 Tax=Nereida sp. MMG025 TaxID=2909981 RepID=UPI001F414E14|nr:YraN family protein [Nereida sp. MMG025]MCF6445540.1 YraN family protein [Nereida sp. MMG025]